MDDQKERNRKTMETLAASLAEETPVSEDEAPKKSVKSISLNIKKIQKDVKKQ
jgi:phosphohistidine phosphatase SixA